MEIHQISTGNLFLHEGKIIEIERVESHSYPFVLCTTMFKTIRVSELKPIPATLSELQKLGFELVEDTFYNHPKMPFLQFDSESSEFWLNDTSLGKMYIHEIQNMISVFERFNFGV